MEPSPWGRSGRAPRRRPRRPDGLLDGAVRARTAPRAGRGCRSAPRRRRGRPGPAGPAAASHGVHGWRARRRRSAEVVVAHVAIGHCAGRRAGGGRRQALGMPVVDGSACRPRPSREVQLGWAGAAPAAAGQPRRGLLEGDRADAGDGGLHSPRDAEPSDSARALASPPRPRSRPEGECVISKLPCASTAPAESNAGARCGSTLSRSPAGGLPSVDGGVLLLAGRQALGDARTPGRARGRSSR